MKFFNVALVFLLSICFINTNTAQWSNIGLPYGYYFESGYIDQGGNIFIRTNKDYYYSNDLGKNWTKTGFVLSQDPNDKQIVELENHDIILKQGNSVYKFDQLNKNWQFIDTTIYQLLNIDSQGFLWCKHPLQKGVYLSKDFGKNYIFIKTTTNQDEPVSFNNGSSYKDQFNIITVNFHNQNVSVLGIISDSLSIVPVTGINGFTYLNPKTGTIFIDDFEGKFNRSTDTGATFQPIDIGLTGIGYGSHMQLMQNGNLYLHTDGKVLISDDDGKTWKNLDDDFISGIKPSFALPSVVGFVNLSDTIISLSTQCEYQGVYQSINKGGNWTYRNDNFFNPTFEKLVEDKSGYLYAKTCSDTTFLYSKDLGKNWNRFLIEFENKQYGIYDIAININGDIFATTKWAAFKSVDGGQTFQIISNLSYHFSSSPTNCNIYAHSKYIYISSFWKGFSFSEDYGFSWTSEALSQINNKVKNIDEKGYLYWEGEYSLYKYNPYINKNEEIYYKFSTPKPFYNFTCLRNGLIVFLEYDNNNQKTSLWLSKDDMDTFEELPKANNTNFSPIFTDSSSNIYILRDDGIYISIDVGQNFDYFAPYAYNWTIDEFYVSPFDHLFTFKGSTLVSPIVYKYDNKLLAGNLIEGFTYFDDNKNCVLDTLEFSKDLLPISVSGTSNFTVFSDTSGKYKFRLNSGNYNIKTYPPNALWETCKINNLTVVPGNKDTIPLDLGIYAIKDCPYLSVNVQCPIMRRCFDNKVYIKYCNEGNATSFNTSIEVSLNQNMSYLSSSIIPQSQVGQTLVFNLGDLDSRECGMFIVDFNLNCDATLGEEICINAFIKPDNQCSNNLPNLAETEKCVVATGSFDPNDKTAFINGKPSKGNTEMNEDIEYLIRFQNTGTDTAFRIVVRDILPINFDINTLKILSSSHPFTMEIQKPGILKFIFDPIMLPDSNINEPASHGFIAFRISPKSNLDYGTNLDNYADIFFDYNEPVRTDTAFLTVSKSTYTSVKNDKLNFNYYPNPTKGDLGIYIDNGQENSYSIKVCDILGKEIYIGSWSGNNYTLKSPISKIPGIYIIKITDENGKNGFGKFVILTE